MQSASFADPYLLIIKVDGSAIILEADTSGEFDKIEQSETLASSMWLSGCVYKSPLNNYKAILCLLSKGGSIKVCNRCLGLSLCSSLILLSYSFSTSQTSEILFSVPKVFILFHIYYPLAMPLVVEQKRIWPTFYWQI